jgi:hypothetical protein
MRVVHYLLAAAVISLLATNVTFADDRHVRDANDTASGSDVPKNNSKAGNVAGTSQSDANDVSDKNAPPSGADFKENSKTGDEENPKTGDAKTTNVKPSTNDSDIAADGLGRKLKKQLIDATKKTTTIGPTHRHWVNGIHHLAAISQRNAVGLALQQDDDPKRGTDVKFGANGLPGPIASTHISHSGTSKGIDGPPKIDAGHSLKVIRNMSPGTASLGGPVKTTWGTLSGNAFRPKQPWLSP